VNVITVKHPGEVPVKWWVWCKGQSPEMAVAHIAEKFNIAPPTTVYAFWDSIAVPLEVTQEEFQAEMDNKC
jgi:hypothetical protein